MVIFALLMAGGTGAVGVARGDHAIQQTKYEAVKRSRPPARPQGIIPSRDMRNRDRLLEKKAKGQLPKALDRMVRRKAADDMVTPTLGRDRAWNNLVRKKPNLRRSEGTNALSDSVLALWVRHFSAGLAPSLDAAAAIAVDGNGNVYVTGYSTGMFSGHDYVTIKYNAQGLEQWVARYNGPANDYDEATAIAVDASGNVYVTGSSFGTDTEEDYATVKYNSAGIQQWVARYNGPADDYDAAVGIKVDGSGNVHVTGVSYGVATDADIATIKYNSSGIQLWAARYNGTGNDEDIPAGVGLDLSGSVYVAGTAYGSATYEDFVIVKYSYLGDQAWVATYDGTGNDYDAVTAMTTDISGNTYVVGMTYNLEFDSDYLTMKYDTFGRRLWSSRYEGPDDVEDIPTAIALDAARQVYVTGTSAGLVSDDYTTIKYSSTGVTRWVRQYNGPANSFDEATAIAVDGTGNVHVTGMSYGVSSFEDYATVKYNTDGEQIWVGRYSGTALDYDVPSSIAIDGSGNVYVTGTSYGTVSDEDFATVKYNVNGVEQWSARYNGPGNSEDELVAMAMDPAGNIYVTGTSYDEFSQSDYATVKYSPGGVQQWVARYNGPGDAEDFATAIAVDAVGNVYVTGTSYSDTTGYDILTIKYATQGNQLWTVRYSGAGNTVDEGGGIAVDQSGNVYVTGSRYDAVNGYDFVTLKYLSNGQQQWVSFYNGPSALNDQAVALALDGSGNVYATGVSLSVIGGKDFATVKYNSSGVQQWAKRFNGSTSSSDEPSAIAVGSSGVYVTGTSLRSISSFDYATIKYSTAGDSLWVVYYSGPGANTDIPSSLKLDASGNVYVTGASAGSGTALDFATVKYSASGIQQWAVRHNSSENDDDAATALALDPNGNVYVTGFSFMFESGYDFATVKYNASGEPQWASRYDNPGQFSDEPLGIAVDQYGNVVVAGLSETDEGSVYTTVKYEAPLISVSQASFNFGTVDVGCRSIDTVVVRNTAQVNFLTVSNAYGSNQNFTVSPASFTVAPGDSKKVAIRFAPLTAGAKTGNVVFVHNGIASPSSIPVLGSGAGAGTAALYSTNLGLGWRLFSLPVRVTCPLVVPFSYAFTNQYFRSDTLSRGRAYWTKLADPIMHITGFLVPSDSIPLQQGWNLVGTISSPVATSSISTVPSNLLISSFFGYSGTYFLADTIKPGFGYWVKSLASGVMLVNSAMPARPQSGRDLLADAQELKFTDAASRTQHLFVRMEQDDDRQLVARYELPPLPPDGELDVRYSSQRMVELLGRTDEQHDVQISSAVYPVTVRWSGNPAMESAFLMIDGKENSLTVPGEVKLLSPHQEVTVASGVGAAVPMTFALHQNYPNPFNPHTQIRYQLAEAGHVTITVFNMLGQTVKTLLNEDRGAGIHTIVWDGLNDAGKPVSSGIYLYRLSSSRPGSVLSDTRKMALVR